MAPSGPLTGEVDLGNTSAIYGSQVVLGHGHNIWSAYQGNGVAITSVASSGGYANFTKSSHGLTVGTVIMVTDSTAGGVDGVQKITAVTSNTFKTNKVYVASAAAGSYHLKSGRFASMSPTEWIIKGGVTITLADTSNVLAGFGADFGIRQSIHKVLHVWTKLVATAIRAGQYNIYSGKFNPAVTSQDDISSFGADNEANVGRNNPGDLIYRVSGQPDGSRGITVESYPDRTN